MENINEAILFYDTSSQICREPLSMIKRNNLPIICISTSSSQTRQILKNGKFFRVKRVPIIMLSSVEGNIQVYEGITKVMQLINNIIHPPVKNPPSSNQNEKEIENEKDVSDVEIIEDPLDTVVKESEELNAQLKQEKSFNINDLAKQMAREREENLGYDEKNLPYA